MKIEITPIGYAKTEFKELVNMPIQPRGGMDKIGEIIVDEKFKEGLKDLDGFNFIYLIYYFHKSKQYNLTPIPFNDKTHTPRGVFSTRTPVHPNFLGLSVVELIEVKDNVVKFKGVDILDNTPIIDIKPYIENFDKVCNPKSGWMKSSEDEVSKKRADDRFC
jgi:tRNA-Thr(GGU) m(6)t(6)A37 methyltransferase TsaA